MIQYIQKYCLIIVCLEIIEEQLRIDIILLIPSHAI